MIICPNDFSQGMRNTNRTILLSIVWYQYVLRKPGRAIFAVILPVIAGAIWPAMKIHTAITYVIAPAIKIYLQIAPTIAPVIKIYMQIAPAITPAIAPVIAPAICM